MPEQDYNTGELNQGHVVLDVILVADHQPAEVVKPGKQPLDLPSPLEAPQSSAILGFALRPASLTMRCDHLRTESVEYLFVQRIAIISFVPNQFFRHLSDEALFERSTDQLHFSWASTL